MSRIRALIAGRVLMMCSLGTLLFPITSWSQSVQCDSDKAVLPGHGPASAITGNQNDNRRVIRVVINNLGNANDPTSWYEPSTGGVNQQILAGTQAGANAWNSATDQSGNQTGYYFHVIVSQSAQDLANADIIVDKRDIVSGCQQIEVFGGSNLPIKLSFPPDAATRPADRLKGNFGHEFSHPLGLHDALLGSCAGQTIAAGAAGCSSPLQSNEVANPTAADVSMANQFLNSGPGVCTVSSSDPTSCANPCDSPSCQGYSAQACSNDEETTQETTEDPVEQTCTAWWNVTSYYRCNADHTQCTYLGSDWTYLYTSCSGDACGGCTCGGTCQNGNCIYTFECSPIIIAVGSNSDYQLTSPQDGVFFDLNGDGVAEQISWTRPGDSVAFLVLDGNGNGQIDNGAELFGNHSILPSGQPVTNGFEALAYYDKPSNGGNGDGQIDSRDSIWSSLRLWIDWNHDGISQSSELSRMEDWQVSSVSLQFQTIQRTDGYGNVFRLKAPCQVGPSKRFAYDVFFSAKPQRRPQ